jgi:hypothetical protein
MLADAGDVAGLELKKLKEELATWDADKAREKAALEMRIKMQRERYDTLNDRYFEATARAEKLRVELLLAQHSRR